MSDTSTRCPRPVRSRAWSAASTPVVAYSPQIMSIRAAPTFSGRPSGSPVTLIRPLIACSSRSYPGSRAACSPEPNALIEQYTTPGFVSATSS